MLLDGPEGMVTDEPSDGLDKQGADMLEDVIESWTGIGEKKTSIGVHLMVEEPSGSLNEVCVVWTRERRKRCALGLGTI